MRSYRGRCGTVESARADRAAAPAPQRACLVSYYFPPNDTIASLRAAKAAKYLPQFGWEPVVVARRWFHEGRLSREFFGKPNWDLYEDSTERAVPVLVDAARPPGPVDGLYASVRDAGMRSRSRIVRLGSMPVRAGLSTLQRLVEPFPDEFAYWSRVAIEAALRDDDVRSARVVWSSSPPLASHVVAGAIASRLELPWIADFRDLWAARWAPWWRIGISLRRGAMRRLERRILRRASLIITISEPMAEQLREVHGAKRVVTLPNGFDPDDYPATEPSADRYFTIRYTGSVYPGLQTPQLLFAALARLIEDRSIAHDDLRVEFYGSQDPRIESLAADYGVTSLVAVLPRVPVQQSARLQREATMLLVLNQVQKEARGILTGKIFEYVGARRPILAIPDSQKVVRDLIVRTRAGRVCDRVDEVAEFLRSCYGRWLAGGRHLAWEYDDDERRRLSRREQAGTLARLFRAVIEA